MIFVQKMSRTINKFSCYLMIAFFIVAFLATVYQVFSRYIINSPFLAQVLPAVDFGLFNFTWIEELIRYLFVWIVFLGIGTVYKEKGHAHVELLLLYLPKVWQKRLIFIIECINASFFILLIYLGAAILKTTSLQVSPSLNINMTTVYMSIFFCSLICLVHSAAHFAAWVSDYKVPKPLTEEKMISKNVTT
ncbi:TRAP transporter small permease [Metabacillus arenae]|uniref:TRAP transporter small permease n=1 Tax=Metabacillus arenae TaxID=2771434 RepID=A0A926NFH7_9BACI|nr:TRAP transporter small permease [Metabacillus arenae]MBD1380604.1 TRAP transporter small permease [Metabacillus arenae]